MGNGRGHLPSAGQVRRLLSEDELAWVLERATSLSTRADPTMFTDADALRLGRELGVDPRAIHQAILELDRSSSRRGLGHVVAEGVIPVPVPTAAEQLRNALRARLMDPCTLHEPGCWTQHRDWWPDVQRLGSELHVTAEVRPAAGSTYVRLAVDMRPKALGYAATAGGGSAIVWLALGLPSLVLAVTGWAAVAGAAVAAYRRRAAAIEARLSELILQLG